MINWENIKPELVPILKSHKITEKDLFTDNESDLYVGCRNEFHAKAILADTNPTGEPSIAGPAIIFRPQKGTDMQHYIRAIDFAFCYYGEKQ